jgi:hypothetical protein
LKWRFATETWRDPRRGELSFAEWAQTWLPTRFDLRPTTWARLETTNAEACLPYFGSVPLNRIPNAVVREWVSDNMATSAPCAVWNMTVSLGHRCGQLNRDK